MAGNSVPRLRPITVETPAVVDAVKYLKQDVVDVNDASTALFVSPNLKVDTFFYNYGHHPYKPQLGTLQGMRAGETLPLTVAITGSLHYSGGQADLATNTFRYRVTMPSGKTHEESFQRNVAAEDAAELFQLGLSDAAITQALASGKATFRTQLPLSAESKELIDTLVGLGRAKTMVVPAPSVGGFSLNKQPSELLVEWSASKEAITLQDLDVPLTEKGRYVVEVWPEATSVWGYVEGRRMEFDVP
jgi:hypothetical protein